MVDYFEMMVEVFKLVCDVYGIGDGLIIIEEVEG